MQFLEQEISEIAEATWQLMVGVEVRPGTRTATMAEPNEFVTGLVDITGAWNGVVSLHGSEPLVRVAAAVIFGKEERTVTGQDKLDAMYELTNIMGGNIKGLLPEPCQLSLPRVEEATVDCPDVRGAERLSHLAFNCQGQPMYLTLWKR